MTDRLGVAWRAYRTRVIPVEAPAVQARECRRAFYAGAHALLHAMLQALEPGAEPTPADLRMMDELAEELDAFGKAVKEGRA